MFLTELFEDEIENKGQIQGELLSSMADTNNFVQVKWQDMTDTEGYQLMSDPRMDPSFKAKLNQIFVKFLGVEMENTITASTVVNKHENIMKIISYLQRNTNQKMGIDPKRLNLHVDNYEVLKASVFNWRGAIFLVIKDQVGPPPQKDVIVPGREIYYHIYAAKEQEIKKELPGNITQFPGKQTSKSEEEKYANALAKQQLDRRDESTITEKSKSKSQSRLMTAACKNSKFRKKVDIPKKVACDYHEKDRGSYHK